jgi:polyphosphate glucokinase
MKALGIDIGGSGIKGAVVDVATGRLLTPRLRADTPEPARPASVARAVAHLAKRFAWKGPIGIGFPGIVRRHVAVIAANLHPTWSGVDLARLFGRATKCPVHVLNDADAAGLGEVAFGAGRRHDGTIIVLTFGTGIGSALIRDGVLIPNLEFGHLKFKHTIAEKYASAAVRKNEDLSWREWGQRVNELLHHVQLMISPELFILGGGVSAKFERFAPCLDVSVKVVPARLLNDAGIVGSALSAARMLPRAKLKVRSFAAPPADTTNEID